MRMGAVVTINFDVPKKQHLPGTPPPMRNEYEDPLQELMGLLSQMDEVGQLNVHYTIRNLYQIGK